MPRLQVALDGDLTSALAILEKIHPFVDIAEVGTPLIFREGMNAVQQIRQAYPDLALLADLKIMDAGEEEAHIAYAAGADIVTVLGVTNDATIKSAVNSAGQHHGQIMVDMMQVARQQERATQLLQMGCHVLCVHTAYDLQTSHHPPYRELEQLRQHLPSAQLAIAGGVNLEKLAEILPYQPDIIVVGGAITRAFDPAHNAQQLYQRIHAYADS
ncbi:3-hexulose-6-phosphate synthase [Chloroflexota bacterium]